MNTAIEKPTDMLNTEQAAAVLGIQPQTLRAWLCLGRPGPTPRRRIGRSVRYMRRDLEMFIERSAVTIGDAET